MMRYELLSYLEEAEIVKIALLCNTFYKIINSNKYSQKETSHFTAILQLQNKEAFGNYLKDLEFTGLNSL